MENEENKPNYADGFNVKEKDTAHGKIKFVGIKWEKFREWAEQNVNENGFINLKIRPRKNGADQFGNTHSAILDTWKPESQK